MPEEEQTSAPAPDPELPQSQQEMGVDCLPRSEPLPSTSAPHGIAPLWHTALLVAAILAYSLWGAIGAKSGSDNPLTPIHSAAHAAAGTSGTDRVRLIRYALTGLLELAVVGWVALGLRLRRIPFRSLFDAWPRGLNNITVEAGIAALFWIASMVVLVTLALSWSLVQNRIYKHQTANASTQSAPYKSGSAAPKSPQEQQTEMVRQLTELAPANGLEIAAWAALCLIVGFSEELIFRGYLQAQSIGFLHSVPIGVVLSAVIFGAAHGYQGVRGIVLISVYGALFGVIALVRRNLFPGMLAHTWHDFATGMALALIRSTHLLDHLPSPAK